MTSAFYSGFVGGGPLPTNIYNSHVHFLDDFLPILLLSTLWTPIDVYICRALNPSYKEFGLFHQLPSKSKENMTKSLTS